MAKPLISTDPNPKDVRFSHFGVLDTGKRSKGAAITSIAINGSILLVILIIGAAIKNNPALAKKITELTLPKEPPPPPPKPKVPPPPPPKPLPKPPDVKIEPPRIKPLPVPEKVPEMKPVIVPTPKPVVLAPAPKRVNPPPAPKVVNLSRPMAASIANNDAHPSPVRLGNPEIRALNGPPVTTPVNLGGGMHGMPPSNTGSGPRATHVNLGSGSPQGTDLNGRGRGAVVVHGLNNGIPGGTGHSPYQGPTQVHLQQAPPPQQMARAVVSPTSATAPPTVTYKPEPVYTAEAKAMHLEGTVSLRIRVTASGAVEILGITKSLGHGLDESAEQATRNTRFRPAHNAAGNPVDWTGVVVVRFQLS